MSHCGAALSCSEGSKVGDCACGAKVREELAARDAQELRSRPPRAVVALGAVRKLVGRQIEETRSA